MCSCDKNGPHLRSSVLLARLQLLNLGGNRREANLDETLMSKMALVSKATAQQRNEKANNDSNRSSVEHKPPLATCDSAKNVCYLRQWMGFGDGDTRTILALVRNRVTPPQTIDSLVKTFRKICWPVPQSSGNPTLSRLRRDRGDPSKQP